MAVRASTTAWGESKKQNVRIYVLLAASNLVGVVNESCSWKKHHLEFYPFNTVNNSSPIHFFCVGSPLKAWKYSQAFIDPVKFLMITV
jgi:hypothetical protein